MRGNPNEDKIKTLVRQLQNLGVNIQHKNHELICSTRKITVDKSTGEIIEEHVVA
jgi:hypothetical protein